MTRAARIVLIAVCVVFVVSLTQEGDRLALVEVQHYDAALLRGN